MWLLLLVISAASTLLAQTDAAQGAGIGALPLAIVLGIIAGNVFTDRYSAKSEWLLAFSKKRLLRLGIILFGSHLTLQQVASVGIQAALLDAVVIVCVLGVGYLLGMKVLGMSREETILTSVGSAVCGAAAILATEPVLNAKQQQVSVAVATVVVFGTLALFSYPVIFSLTDLSSASFGIYIGSTVHEVAQAVAAGQAIDAEAMNNAIIVKLIRVMMLAPVVIVIGWLYQRAQTPLLGQASSAPSGSIPIPWFVFGFVLMVGINSFIVLPDYLSESLKFIAQISLTIAMAALGIQTKMSAVRAAGVKPMLLSAVLFVMLLGGGFIVHQLIY